jgi:hypothetical protein
MEAPMQLARTLLLGLAVVSLSPAPGTAQAPVPTLPYDHIHLNVPDPAAGADWYEKHFGGKRITEAPNRLMFGSTRFMFLRSATAKPSAGSAIDHVGFSVPDLDAKMKSSSGRRQIDARARVPGLFKLAFVEDPGARASRSCRTPPAGPPPHPRSPNPDEAFGGALGQRPAHAVEGRIDAVKSADGFSDMWIW